MERTRLQMRTLWAVLGATVALAWASPASAQYFGRNKVQYETFDFQVVETPHFDVYLYPEERTAALDAARMAERWYSRLSTILDHEFEERQPIVLYGSHPAFQQTTTLQGDIGEGTGGVTEALKQRVIMPLTGSYQETDHVMGHELVHAFQYDISGLGRFRGSLGAGARAFGGAPLWFTEGMAEYLSVGPVDPNTSMWLRDAVLTGNLPTAEQLTRDPRFFPYRWGQALWAYVGGRWGDATIGNILRLVGQGIPYQEAFERVLNIELDELVQDWHVSIRRSYLPLLTERAEARELARPLITQEREGGRLNIGPSLSPDGRLVAFISSRSNLDVELYVANARTGEVLRRLQKGTAFDSHYQSLRYISSAGTWSPDSRRVAFSALRAGRDRLVIVDATNSNRLDEITIPEVIEITSPTWSPDGRTIVFSGIAGGISDLYAHDIEAGQTRRLTNDLFANLHPTFSPDGSTIAFVTDQGPGTDLAQLRYTGYRIGLLRLAGGEVELVPATLQANSVNPAWTRDGQGLFFVSTRNGIPNIFRVNLASGELFQLTRLFGGVSGITDLSPSLTAARNEDRVLFTAYEEGGYNIYALSTAQELAGTPVTDLTVAQGAPLPAQLPPVPRPEQAPFTRVSSAIADVETGLISPEAAANWQTRPYRPKLALDYLGQPQLGVAVGGVAGQGGLYGAVTGLFSDLLGYHTLIAAVQAQGEYDEVGFQTMYLNQKHRWNWGALAQRIPYIMLFPDINCGDSQCPSSGQTNVNLDYIRYRYFDTSLQGVAQYPFSPSRRIEFTGGLRRIAEDAIVDRFSGIGTVQGGQLFQFQAQSHERFKDERFERSFNMVQGSAALVYDNSLFGYTSPFAGQRYRFEVSPTLGQISFTQLTADYRRYFFARPFTLAVRGFHFGRYGRDEGVFRELFLGYPYFMRGYYNAYNDCRNQDVSACQTYQSLIGTRLAVANVELRFPLIRALVIGPIGFPPIEGIGFFDAGTAWNRDTSPVFARGAQLNPSERGILSSAGVGARVNLLGYAVLEIDYVKPLDTNRDWHWQFALQPGF